MEYCFGNVNDKLWYKIYILMIFLFLEQKTWVSFIQKYKGGLLIAFITILN